MSYELITGDCLEQLRQLEANSIDAIVTDPPAGISFMGKDWDSNKGGRDQWIAWLTEVMAECLRVAKPGAHALVWALPRTSHWTATALENAQWTIRDIVTHHFGSGFPKSLDVSKAIDKAAGATREVVGTWKPTGTARPTKGGSHSCAKTTADCGYDPDTEARIPITAPATNEAMQWEGFGTALKPASEHWILARKPLSECTVAANVLRWGTGGLNIDAARIEGAWQRSTTTKHDIRGGRMHHGTTDTLIQCEPQASHTKGRWPANAIFSGEAVAELSRQSGNRPTSKPGTTARVPKFDGDIYHASSTPQKEWGYGDTGTAARFFYCPKASKKDRGTGNDHPTVKNTELMGYLVRLITPPGGTVLDCFSGSGSTAVAALREGMHFVGIELSEHYNAIAEARIKEASE